MIQPGAQLGHYEITDPIGRGGMGEVYRARDTKLGREVAIKVLPQEFSQDAERLARLEREARMLAALNHPNIASIYGLEQSDDTRFLVLELVEGETLAERLEAGAIPVEESLKLALQIAEALEAAHERGVVHRDLKPANIKITPQGRVKVLDFGLAKAFEGTPGEGDLSNSPTLSIQATQQGVILGTAAYMSPEQASGQVTDRRADIWSLGVVLYEMLTGRRTFTGETVSHVLAAVIKSEPDWNNLPAGLNPRVRYLLEQCLDKSLEDRYHDIADVRVDLQRALSDPVGLVYPHESLALPSKRKAILAWSLGAAGLTVLVMGFIGWWLWPGTTIPLVRFDYLLEEGQQFPLIDVIRDRRVLDISPSGSHIAYVADEQIWVLPLEQGEAHPISDPGESPRSLFFGPEGDWIGYWSASEGALKRIRLDGGVPQFIAAVPADTGYGGPPGGAHWGPDGRIVYAQVDGMWSVSATGGTPEPLVESSAAVYSPQTVPGGEAILFDRDGMIVLYDLEAGEEHVLFAGRTSRYLDTGHLVYHDGQRGLVAVPFDLGRRERTGSEVLLESPVRLPQYALSDTGTLVYVPELGDGARNLVLVDLNGNEELLSVPADVYQVARASPDEGNRIALLVNEGTSTIITVWDLERGIPSTLTTDAYNVLDVVWSHDGNDVLFYSNRNGEGLYIVPADGGGSVELVQEGILRPDSVSPDGQFVGINQGAAPPAAALISLDTGDLSLLLEDDRANFIMQPQFSPDGDFVAMTYNDGGNSTVIVVPFPDVTASRGILPPGSFRPAWAKDGRGLFFQTALLGGIGFVPVDTSNGFDSGEAVAAVVGDYVTGDAVRAWDPWPDGRVLMIKPADPASRPTPRIEVVQNWIEEMTARVGR